MKRRILVCGESSWVSTGFAKYNQEVLRRLFATNKFEIAEMGSYGSDRSPEAKELPWKFYGVLPNSEKEKQLYESNPTNAFGAYKINAVLADFQPDIVFDARDPWMTTHIQNSKFRSMFKLALMPTVDSAPQRKDWINGLFKQADIVTTYSRYGKKVLEATGVKVDAVTSPGINLDIFKKIDKQTIRDKYQIKPSLLIIGTVMRNQKRKLYPELFEVYSALRKKYRMTKKNKEDPKTVRINHSALLCHTSWPDNGWDIPELLDRYNLARHVIFTYKCEGCSSVFHSWFIPCDTKGNGVCRICGEKKAHMPNTHSGVSEEELVDIYNLMDIYVQPAICEGWGLPIMEAKACGVPGLYQNYSAMEDHVENGGGLPIKIGRFYTEAETMAIRSLPDNKDFLKGLETLALSGKKRDRLGKAARKCCVEIHDWKITTDKLERLFTDLELHDRGLGWDKAPAFSNLTQQRAPQNLSDSDFVHWCYQNILGRPADEKGFGDWTTNLAKGGSRQSVESFFRNEINGQNIFEEIRWNNSLKIRGIKPEQQAKEKTNNLPGALV
jgi:glycosyltransferase involved in cell wall biosynthesis